MLPVRNPLLNRPYCKQQRRGAIAVLALFLMVIFLVVLALAIDTGVMYNTREDLQRAVDSGALAAVKEILLEPTNVTAKGQEYVQSNLVLNSTIPSSDISVQTGIWNLDTRLFTPGTYKPNAVKVNASSNDNAFFFAHVLDATTFNMTASATATFQPRDMMLVLDYSGSMLDENKINDLKTSVDMFCTLVGNIGQGYDRIGFVRYSTTATMEQTLSFDTDLVNSEAQTGDANGWTDIGDGILLARTELNNNGRSKAKKSIILLTDGMANKPEGVDPIQYVRDQALAANAENYPITTISFGSDAEQTLMAYVATVTGSSHFHVDSSSTSGYSYSYSSYQSWNSEDDSINPNGYDALQAVFRKIAMHRGLQIVD